MSVDLLFDNSINLLTSSNVYSFKIRREI